MYAPHASQAHARPASHPHPRSASAVRLASLGLPAIPLPGPGANIVEAPTLGVVDGVVRVPPEVPALAVPAALLAFYVCQRLLRGRSRSRCQTWYGLGAGLVGSAITVVAVGGWLGASAFTIALGVNLVAVGAGLAFLAALLTMPGPPTTFWIRIRRALDGAIVGLCFILTGRILVTRPLTNLDSPAYWLIMFQCCVLATAVLAGVRPRTHRRGPVLCAAGVAAAMVGLSPLAFAIAYGAPLVVLVPILALLAAAPLLILSGIGQLTPGSPAMAPRTPLVAVPAALALTAALYQLATGGELDRGAMMLGTLAALAVGVRRLLPALASMPARAPAPAPVPAPVPVAASALAAVAASPLASPLAAGTALAVAAPVATPVAGIASLADPVPVVPGPRSGDDHQVRNEYNDPVTGLSSRTRILLSIAAIRCNAGEPGALLVIGVDGLPAAPGAARDTVLREVGRRLSGLVAKPTGDRTARADLPARITATEFAILTQANLALAYRLAERVVAELGEPIPVGRETLRLSACVGLSDLAGAASTEETILRASLALRRAQQLGPGRVEWYDSAVAAAVARREVLERELPDAVRHGELDLIYQPIMDLERSRPLAVEALLRWRHPRLGTLLPADVIPAAEATGAIADVGRWVLRKATAQLASWRADGRNLSMAINVSPRQLRTATFAADVTAALAAHDLPAERLVLEVAESAIEDGAGLDESIVPLRTVGVRMALDEFGGGAASLAHLRTLPIDMVKIGQPLFGAAESSLFGVMVGVGRRLGIDVVAQGVEAPDQLAAVREAGCRLGQGHFFARPLPAEHTEAYLDGFGAH